MSKTKIEWSEFSWNPVTGCSAVSEGCRNCYAKRMSRRLAGRFGYPEYPHHFNVTPHRDRLDIPRWREKPTTYFICSMGDLFHEDVPFTFISKVWAEMAWAKRHTFQILTKRPERMLEYVTSLHTRVAAVQPLKNVWLGVSVENQATADERIPLLLQTPAAVRFVSVEPLLGPIDLRNIVIQRSDDGNHDMLDALNGMVWFKRTCIRNPHDAHSDDGLNLVIVGGESGPGARPMHPDWARSLRDQCQEAGVPYFYKQQGAWLHESQFLEPVTIHTPNIVTFEERTFPTYQWPDGTQSYRVGKKHAGRLLDGREWNEMPEVISDA